MSKQFLSTVVGFCLYLFFIPLAHAQQTIVVGPEDTSFVCLSGQSFQVSGEFDNSRYYDTCTFYVDGVSADQHGAALGKDDYKFTWSATTTGPHELQVIYTKAPQGRKAAQSVNITVVDSPPVVFKSLPASTGVNIAVTVTNAGALSYPLSRVDFYFRDKWVSASTYAPFTATIPVEDVAESGVYPLRFVTKSTSGTIFYSAPTNLEITPRVVAVIASPATEQKQGDTIAASATLISGIKAVKETFFVTAADTDDWQQLGEATTTPFSAALDLSNLASGAYQLKVKAVTSAGVVYESAPTPFTFTNGPQDAALGEKAKAQAVVDAQAAAKDAQIADLQKQIGILASEVDTLRSQLKLPSIQAGSVTKAVAITPPKQPAVLTVPTVPNDANRNIAIALLSAARRDADALNLDIKAHTDTGDPVVPTRPDSVDEWQGAGYVTRIESYDIQKSSSSISPFTATVVIDYDRPAYLKTFLDSHLTPSYTLHSSAKYSYSFDDGRWVSQGKAGGG